MTVQNNKDILKAYFAPPSPVFESEMIDVFDSQKFKDDDEESVTINAFAPNTNDRPFIMYVDRNITLTYFLPVYDSATTQLTFSLVRNRNGTLTDLVAAGTTSFGHVDGSGSFGSATLAVTSLEEGDLVYVDCGSVGSSIPMSFMLRFKDA